MNTARTGILTSVVTSVEILIGVEATGSKKKVSSARLARRWRLKATSGQIRQKRPPTV